MAARSTSKTLVLAGLLSFAAGVLAGGALVSAWSRRASRLYVQMTRFSFALEQERALGEAWRRGDMPAALRHAACQVEADKPSRAFDPSESRWTYWYPLYGAVISARPEWGVASGKNIEAIAHAQLAVVWEQLGNAEAARSEYQEAIKITGSNQEDRWRQIARSELDRILPSAARQ